VPGAAGACGFCPLTRNPRTVTAVTREAAGRRSRSRVAARAPRSRSACAAQPPGATVTPSQLPGFDTATRFAAGGGLESLEGRAPRRAALDAAAAAVQERDFRLPAGRPSSLPAGWLMHMLLFDG
jgi:hypothetical protein